MRKKLKEKPPKGGVIIQSLILLAIGIVGVTYITLGSIQDINVLLYGNQADYIVSHVQRRVVRRQLFSNYNLIVMDTNSWNTMNNILRGNVSETNREPWRFYDVRVVHWWPSVYVHNNISRGDSITVYYDPSAPDIMVTGNVRARDAVYYLISRSLIWIILIFVCVVSIILEVWKKMRS